MSSDEDSDYYEDEPLISSEQEEDEDEPECVHGSVQPTKEVLGKVTSMNYIFF